MHYGTMFQPAMSETWQECFYTTLDITFRGILLISVKLYESVELFVAKNKGFNSNQTTR